MKVYDQSSALEISTTKTSVQRPICVGYVLNRFPRLSETFIPNELLELQRKGMLVFALIEPDKNIRHSMLTQLWALVRINYFSEDSWVDACCNQQGGFMKCFLHIMPFAYVMQGMAADREGAHAA